MWLTRSDDPDIRFVVNERLDRAAAQLKQAERELSEKDAKAEKSKRKTRPSDGISLYVVPVNANEEPLEYGGLTRQRFTMAAIQETQDREDGIDVDRNRPDEGYNPADYGDG